MITLLLLIIIYCSFISLGLPDSLLGTAWPLMQKTLQLPQTYAGIISLIIAGCTIISSLFSGRILKHLRTQYVLVISVIMTAAALFGFSAGRNFLWLVLCAFPLGLGAGSVDTALNNYVAVHFKAKHMSWLHCFWGIGATMGPVVMAHFLAGGNWQSGYRVISLVQTALAALLVLSLPLWKKAAAKEAAAGETEPRILSVRAAVAIPGVKAAFLTFFCYCTIESTAGLWGSSYLVLVRGVAPETAAAWVSLYYFGITFGRFLNGFTVMVLTGKQVIRIGIGLLGTGILLVLAAPAGFSLPLTAGFFLIGLGCAPIFPSLIHETPANFGKENSQSVMGMQMASAYTGTTFMPPFFGIIAAHTGYRIFPVFLGIALVIMLCAQERLHRVCRT